MTRFWTCRDCQAVNVVTQGACEACGTTRYDHPKPDHATTIYREFPEPGHYIAPATTDRCPEPGCRKTVGEHIADAKRLTSKIGRRNEA